MIETLCQFAQSITLLLVEKMVAYLGDGIRVIDILQNVILQNVILQNVILQNVILQNVILQNVILQNVIRQNVIWPNVFLVTKDVWCIRAQWYNTWLRFLGLRVRINPLEREKQKVNVKLFMTATFKFLNKMKWYKNKIGS